MAAKEVVFNGDRPTGPLHLGHYIGSLKSRLSLQGKYTQYVMVADVQALTDNFKTPEKVALNVLELARDYLAVGINPEETVIFLQSGVPQIAELTLYYLNLVTLARLERNPTVKAEILQKGYERALPAGFLCYPVSQAADITLFKTNIVAAGDDQSPMIEQANEIVRKFNHIYNTSCLLESRPLLSAVPRLVGIDGKNKASKSLNNAIFLSDSDKIIEQKVKMMFTDPNHLRISDPGQVEGNVVFAYLDAFYPDHDQVAAWKKAYQKGGLGDALLKKELSRVLIDLIGPIREKRNKIQANDLRHILINGTNQAKNVAEATMIEVRDVMGLNNFR
ncbi:MAG: tryptophanyl-tRNA synthetase [Bacillota bacterium]|jgi:tryptophanyl-tRNA synthetase